MLKASVVSLYTWAIWLSSSAALPDSQELEVKSESRLEALFKELHKDIKVKESSKHTEVLIQPDGITAGSQSPMLRREPEVHASFFEQGQKAVPKIDVFLINLDRRPDRCQFMVRQLDNAPHHVQRIVPVDTCELKNDTIVNVGARDHRYERSLFCTNYRIWQKAMKSDADFLMVIEDDATLSQKFWAQVHSFVQNCDHFDYVTVDSWKGGDKSLQKYERVPVCESVGHPMMFRPLPTWGKDYWGTQVQLIRKSFLPRLLELAQAFGVAPLDSWWMEHIGGDNDRAFSWQPNIAPQASAVSQLKHKDNFSKLMLELSQRIAHSEVSPAFLQHYVSTKFACPSPPTV